MYMKNKKGETFPKKKEKEKTGATRPTTTASDFQRGVTQSSLVPISYYE